MSACPKCSALEALKSSTSDASLKTDCAVLLARHPEHGAYPESVTAALEKGAQEGEALSAKLAVVNLRSRRTI